MPRTKIISDEQILQAATRLVGRVGPSRLTLARVAADVGLAPATLVQRFGSKRDLLLAVAGGGATAVAQLLEAAGHRPGARLDVLVDSLLALAEPAGRPEELANHLAFLQLDLRDDAFRAQASAFARAFEDGVRALLAAAVAAGELAPCDTEALARRVQVTYHGSLLTWAIDGWGPLADELAGHLRATLGAAAA